MSRLAATLFLFVAAGVAFAQPRQAAEEIEALLALDRWQPALEQARLADERFPDSDVVSAALAQALLRAGLVEEAAARPPKAKGTVVEDDGSGGVAIADFLSAQKFI